MSHEIRLARLRELINDRFDKSPAKFSQAAGVSLSQLGQYQSGYRSFGEQTARRIERKLNLPNGWLDRRLDELNETERQLLNLFRGMSIEHQAKLMQEANFLFNLAHPGMPTEANPFPNVPLPSGSGPTVVHEPRDRTYGNGPPKVA